MQKILERIEEDLQKLDTKTEYLTIRTDLAKLFPVLLRDYMEMEKEHAAMRNDLQSVQKMSGLLKFNTGCTDTKWQALEAAIGKSLSSLTIK